MKTAVIYARYSSDKQNEQSIEGQLRVCSDYAQRNNLVIVDTYIDRAMTGKNDNRDAFQKMLKDSATKPWDVVLIYKIDRFGRNKYEIAINKHTLKVNGKSIISVMENIPDTPEGIILESVLEGMAEYYSVDLSQKVKRGNRESRLKGNVTNGKVPYGYKIVDKKPVIMEERAVVVKYIYEQYLKNIKVKDIISALTQKGILYKNKPLAENTVYNILKCEKYFGICHYAGEEFDNIFPRIIDKELFESVKQKINANKFGKKSVKTVYLLRRKMICGYCGKIIYAESGTSHTGKKGRYYICSGRKESHDCKKEIVRKDTIEKLIVSKLISFFNEPDNMKTIIREVLKRQEQIYKESALLKTLIKEEKQAQTALKNIVTAIENGVFNNTTQNRMKELEEQIITLQSQISIEQNKTIIKLSEKTIRDYYKPALTVKAELLIDLFIQKVVLFDDKIIVYLNTPITKSPDESQGFLLYEETQLLLIPTQRLFTILFFI